MTEKLKERLRADLNAGKGGALAEEIGGRCIEANGREPEPVEAAVDAAAEAVSHLPFLPAEAAWIEVVRRPVLMDATRARRELRWLPHHDARETLRETIAAVRAR